MTDIVLSGLGLVTAYGTAAGRGVAPFLGGLCGGRRPTISAARDAVTQPIDRATVEGVEPDAWLGSAIAEALTQADWPEVAASPILLLAAQAHAPADTQHPLFAPAVVVAGPHRWERPLVISHACASALFAVHLATRLIRGGTHDAVLVAGVSVCNPASSESLRVVRAIGTPPPRPFDRERDGILIGEGAGAVLVESASALAARGGRPLAEVAASVAEIGGHSSAASDADIVYDVITRVLDEAGATDVDYVHAHATGTLQGDAAEVEAVARLASERGMPDVIVSSHKGALGHLLHASAFPGLVSAVAAVRDGTLPTTVGLRSPLPVGGVRLPTEGPALRSRRPVTHALVNAFGFGGNNASVLVRRSALDHSYRPLGSPRSAL